MNNQQNPLRTIVLLLALAVFASCNFNRTKEIEQLMAQRDSLANVLADRDSSASIMNGYLETIASSLDSIKTAESILTLTVDDNGVELTKDEIKDNLTLLEEIIRRQRDRIEFLEGQLLARNDSTSKYRTLITHLYEQIDQKNAQIKSMEEELERKDVKISSLNRQVTAYRKDLASAEEMNRQQSETIALQTTILSTQDKMVNTGYFIAASKKELQRLGIIGKGSKSKTIVPTALLPEFFNHVDMRDFTEITLQSKSPVVLSPMPSNSYIIKKENGASVLIVTNPGSFWSVSNYLIIQL